MRHLVTNHRTRCCIGVVASAGAQPTDDDVTCCAGYDGDRCLSYRGVGVAIFNGSECHGKQRQGGKLDFNLDFN